MISGGRNHRPGRNIDRNTIFRIILPKIINFKGEQITETISLLIPQSIPPSYQFQGEMPTFAYVGIHYSSRFEVKVQGIFTDFNRLSTSGADELH